MRRGEGIVLDCSAALSLVLPDEKSDDSAWLFELIEAEGALVPPIWTLEVVNALLIAERRGRASSTELDQALSDLLILPIVTSPNEDPERAFVEIRELARTYALSSYDASYLDLAIRTSLPVVTRDERLGMAAEAVGLRLSPP